MKAMQILIMLVLFGFYSNTIHAQEKADFFKVVDQMVGTWTMDKEQIQIENLNEDVAFPNLKWTVTKVADTLFIAQQQRAETAESWMPLNKLSLFYDAIRQEMITSYGQFNAKTVRAMNPISASRSVDKNTITFEVLREGKKFGEQRYKVPYPEILIVTYVSFETASGDVSETPVGKMVWTFKKQ